MDKRQMKKYGIIAVVLIILAIGVLALARAASQPAPLDSFATCLGEKGAKFYGAFWCPHCINQKKMFGASKGKLPYIECSTQDGKGQTQVCIDANVATYPTWEFADGTRLTGEISLQKLAEKTSCVLPQ